jgi:hypothetical protein
MGDERCHSSDQRARRKCRVPASRRSTRNRRTVAAVALASELMNDVGYQYRFRRDFTRRRVHPSIEPPTGSRSKHRSLQNTAILRCRRSVPHQPIPACTCLYSHRFRTRVSGRWGMRDETNCDCVSNPRRAGPHRVVRVGSHHHWPAGKEIDQAAERLATLRLPDFDLASESTKVFGS